MKVAIGADHGAFDRKGEVIAHLIEAGHEVKDFGTYTPDSCDYPAIARSVANAVASGEYDRGIVMCTTGIGISIVANKVKGIRCALCTSEEMAELSRKHNNANMLALGGRMTDPVTAINIVIKWLNTEFDGGRHERRVKMLDEM